MPRNSYAVLFQTGVIISILCVAACKGAATIPRGNSSTAPIYPHRRWKCAPPSVYGIQYSRV